MNAETILRSDVLDIIFENRNKQYGAYPLRRGYDKRLLKSLITVTLLVVIVCGGNYYWDYWNRHNNMQTINVPINDTVKLIDIPRVYRCPLIPKPKPPVASVTNPPPVIVPDNMVKAKDTMHTIDDLADKVISTTNSDGPKSIGDNPSPAPSPEPSTAPEPPVPEPAVLDKPEIMPEFPGGTAALLRFLGKNLQVPDDALEPGQRISVPVKFVVNRDGNLTDVAFLTQAPDPFRKEILRVVGKMPKWKPGSQHGKTVAVYFTIPVIFDMAEN